MPTYSDPDSLDEFALRAGADIRSPLLWTLVDLYLQKPRHTAEETQHFTELVLRLLDQADVDTRFAVARRLVSYPLVPRAVMQRLASDVPDIAALVQPAATRGGTPREPERRAQERVWAAELCELFFAASAAERRLILLNLAYSPAPATTFPAGSAYAAARQLETAALAHNPDAFMRVIERWLGIAPAIVRRIVHDPLGDPVIVVAKAFGMAPDAMQRTLLFANPVVGRSVKRVYELATLFEAIGIRAAHVLVGIWRDADPRPAAKPAQQPEAAGRGRYRKSLPAEAQRKPAGTLLRAAGNKH